MGTISGDPHYQSFDGRNLAYQGRCSYTVTKVCDEFRGESGLQYFSVNAENEQREETGPNVTWTQDIWIEFSAGFDYIAFGIDEFVKSGANVQKWPK